MAAGLSDHVWSLERDHLDGRQLLPKGASAALTRSDDNDQKQSVGSLVGTQGYDRHVDHSRRRRRLYLAIFVYWEGDLRANLAPAKLVSNFKLRALPWPAAGLHLLPSSHASGWKPGIGRRIAVLQKGELAEIGETEQIFYGAAAALHAEASGHNAGDQWLVTSH